MGDDLVEVFVGFGVEQASVIGDDGGDVVLGELLESRNGISCHDAVLGHRILAEAIREQAGVSPEDPRPAVIAHLVLGAIDFALRSADSRRILDVAFDVIINGGSIE